MLFAYYFSKLLLASRNPHKVEELKAIFSGLAEEILTPADFPLIPEPVEDGKNYAQNAQKKAQTYAQIFQIPTLGDDSGLEVEYLKGEPGINSARFLGKETAFLQKNLKMLELLSGVPQKLRKARFVCALALVLPAGKVLKSRGELSGEIGLELKGKFGFGYDPIFYLPKLGKYLAELTPAEKNQISHRANALKNLKQKLNQGVPGIGGQGTGVGY